MRNFENPWQYERTQLQNREIHNIVPLAKAANDVIAMFERNETIVHKQLRLVINITEA